MLIYIFESYKNDLQNERISAQWLQFTYMYMRYGTRFQQLSVVNFFRKWLIRPGSLNEADKYTCAFI